MREGTVTVVADNTSNVKRKQWNSDINRRFSEAVELWRRRKGINKQRMTQAALMRYLQADPATRDDAGEAVLDWASSNAEELPGTAIRDGPSEQATGT